MINNKFHGILPNLAKEALKSPIRYQLAAGILKGGRLIRSPTHNTHGDNIKGCHCGSLHAEHRALLQAFPKLHYRKGKWCFLHPKGKGTKFKKVKEKSYKG